MFKKENIDKENNLYLRCKKYADKQIIKNPWEHPKIRKIGLFGMYIIEATMESLDISAEQDITQGLNNPNPVYIEIVELLKEQVSCYLKNKDHDTRENNFKNLVSTIMKYYPLEDKEICYWTGFIPDIRGLEKAENCLSWIYSVLVMNAL
jgi:hypothetical protein